MGLNKEQAEAVNHVYGPMLVLAGPGSGKTHTLVERVRHLIEDVGIPPNNILVITFSKKAAMEMQARFTNLTGEKNYPVSFGTFHAIFYHILKTYYSYSNDSILTPNEKIKYIKKIGQKMNITQALSESWADDILSKISLFKSMSEPNRLQKLSMSEVELAEFASIYSEYEKLCKLDNKIDFDDMLLMCLNLLKSNDIILKQWQGRYNFFLVDEFQDINDIQYEALKLLVGADKNVFAVGDDDQSIYGFRGSNPSIMKDFMEKTPGIKVTNLCKNYRCSQEVINNAGKLISYNINRIDKYQIARKDNKDVGFVKIYKAVTVMEEAEIVVNIIAQHKNEKRKANIAILYRTAQSITYIEERLLLCGITFNNETSIQGFYNRDWVVDVITYMKISIGNYSRSDIFRVLNKPERNLSREDDYSKLIEKIKIISNMTPYAAVNYILKAIGYEKYMKSTLVKRGSSLDVVNDYISELLLRSRQYKNIREWLNDIEIIKQQGERSQNDNERKDVILQSVHSSKGLEYNNVIVVGLQEGIFPHNKAVTDEDIEEERRLLYVAMTRARENLYLIGRGDNEHGKRVSRFIYELETP